MFGASGLPKRDHARGASRNIRLLDSGVAVDNGRRPSRNEMLHRPPPPGSLCQRQSPSWVQPALVNAATTPLIVLCSLNGMYVASLDVTSQYELDRQPASKLSSLATNARGQVLTASQEGWKIWDPLGQLSEEAKVQRRHAQTQRRPKQLSTFAPVFLNNA
jgi:hypothetical protein